MTADHAAPGNVATWSLLSGPGTAQFSNPTSNHSAVTVSTPGSYTFQWHEVSGACDSSDVVVINFTAQPIANAGNKDQICGLDYTLNAIPSISGATGTWSVLAPMSATFSDVHSPNATAHGTTGYGTYFFIWTEQNGNCVSRDTVQIELLAVPNANAGIDTVGCGEYAHLHADGTYPGYWTSSTNLIYTPNSADPNAQIWLPNIPQGQSYYQVTLTWHAFNGICGGTDDVVITFVRPPKAEAGTTQSVCGRTTQLNADTIGSGIVSAYWTCNVPGMIINQSGNIPYNPTVDASNIPSFFINSQRPVYFYWNATNGPGCSDVDSVLVTFYEIPVAHGGVDTAVCGLNYTNIGTWSLDNPSGLWMNIMTNPGTPTFVPSTSPNATVSVTQFGVYQFIWKEMNAGNTSCYSTDTITINFKVTPMPDAGEDFAVCGKFAQLDAHPTVPGGSWSGPTGIAYYVVNPPDSILTPSEYMNPNAWIRWPSENDTITMYWTEFNGTCYGYDSVNVYFGAIIDAVIQTSPSDSLVCGPSYGLLSAVPPSVGYGYWVDNVLNTTFTPSAQTPNNLTATINTGGTSYYGPHYFQWITVNGNCRDTSDAHYVRFIENPVADAGGNYWPGLFGNNRHIKTDTVCGLNYEMGATPSIGTGTWFSLDNTYVYFTNGVAPGNYTTHVATDSLYITSPTAYSVFSLSTPYREFIWQEINDICTDADTLRLYFAPRPSGQFTTTVPPCRHDSSTIIAHTWPQMNNIDYGITSFEWTYPGGQLSNVISNPNTSDTIYVSWPTGDIHTVTLIATNRWGCHSGIVSGQVVEPPMFNPTDSIVAATCGNCNGEIHLFTSYNGNPNYYTFNWLDTIITSQSYVQDSLCPSRYYNVRVNGQSLSPDAAPATYCHDTIRIWLPDTGYVVARFDTSMVAQMQAAPYSVQFINTSINGRKYSWRVYDESGDLITTSTLQDFQYVFEEEGCYRIVLVATSKQGCRDTMEYKWLCVDSKPEFDIPNVFTPNGDGQNDDFIIHGKAIVEFKCIIFNRWGKKLYEWDDITKGWNGKINGNGADASPGVYYYIVTAKDKKGTDYEEKGYFYLLKEKK
jgi:gliding motility-associated-like protein